MQRGVIMKVSEIKEKGAVDELTVKIVDKQPPRDVRGGTLKVCNCVGEDDTGKINITLWNDDVDKVEEGSTIKITNGWAQFYNEEIQVSAGKMGQLEVIS
jgi:replication factor A1